MSRKISIGTSILVVLLAILITFNVTYLAVNNKYSARLDQILSDYDAYAKLSSVMQIIEQNYIGEYDPEALEDALMRGTLSALGDKYARYLSAEEYARLMEEQSGSMVGIGIIAEQAAEKEAILITYVFEDSPAMEVGLKPGDLLVGIDDYAVNAVSYQEAVELIGGEAGSSVRLTIIRDENRTMEFNLIRRQVTTTSLFHRMEVDAEGNATDVGYLYISGFDSGTPASLKNAIEELMGQGAKSLIFDLRGNPGGELNSVVSALDLLLPQGTIVKSTDKKGEVKTRESDEASILSVPCCVLVNNKTASAAELFAAALMDYTEQGKIDATVIGTRTVGKGSIQTVYRLSDNSAISITTATYSPPYSESIEGVGVTPDEVLECDEAVASVSLHLRDHRLDNQIQRAVEHLSGKTK